MANSYISVDTSKLPLSLELKDGNRVFKLEFIYNLYNDSIYVNLYDSLDNVIWEREKMLYGVPLWQSIMEDTNGNFDPNFPSFYLVPLSKDNTEYLVNRETLNTNVFLVVVERS